MKTVFFTHCTDDWYEPVGCYKLEQSLKRFHPDIPFVRFGSKEINEQMRLRPGLHWDIMIPIWGQMLASDFELVVHFDADSIVTGTLEEVLAGDFEVAGVRNNDDFGISRMSCPNVSQDQFLNCGLVAATNPSFWDEWYTENFISAHRYTYAENDVFNQIFYSGRYRAKLLDPTESPHYYGVAAPRSRWDEFVVQSNRLYCGDKQVKVLHESGGHNLPKLRLLGQFSSNVARWLLQLTNSPCLTNAAGEIQGLGHPALINSFLDSSNCLPLVIQAMNKQDLLRRYIRPCNVVLDLGAHMGLFSSFVSPVAQRIIAFEPFPEFCAVFESTMAHLQITNCDLCRKAVWTSTGERDLLLCGVNRTMNSLVQTTTQSLPVLRVPTISLPDILNSYRLDRIDLLKIDVEGAELAILTDKTFESVASKVRALWVECHPIEPASLTREAVKGRITERLSSLGYRIESFEEQIYAFRHP